MGGKERQERQKASSKSLRQKRGPSCKDEGKAGESYGWSSPACPPACLPEPPSCCRPGVLTPLPKTWCQLFAHRSHVCLGVCASPGGSSAKSRYPQPVGPARVGSWGAPAPTAHPEPLPLRCLHPGGPSATLHTKSHRAGLLLAALPGRGGGGRGGGGEGDEKGLAASPHFCIQRTARGVCVSACIRCLRTTAAAVSALSCRRPGVRGALAVYCLVTSVATQKPNAFVEGRLCWQRRL